MTPEDEARAEIDRKLAESGWVVQDRGAMNIAAGPGVAIREFPLPVGEADYLLYADMRAIGVVEAKPKGFALTGVEGQSKKYVEALPEDVPAHRLPLPFHYESTGSITQFTNLLEPDARSREVFAFHRPEELLRLAGLEEQFRGGLRRMPPLNVEKLWPVQARAVANLEKSLADNRPRSLVQMATGSGKTFTAVSLLYRLVKFAGAKRVLFLVDRKNLGRQTYDEFQKYVSPYNGYKFTDEFNVQHLRSNAIAPASRVCIATIQRVYSMLKGDEEFDEADEEVSSFELASDLIREQMPVAYNPKIPIETFDVIVADECHRSIYNLWRQVLDYFDASLVGLTATPTGQTIGFFRNNLVMEYGHNDAVADGVNVGYQVYRIRTQITEGGAILEQEPGLFLPRRDRRTRKMRYAALDDDLTYSASQLDRDVVAEDQIRLVVRTFRDRLFTEIFPGREVVPKTLVFAKDDSHADDITRIIREEFGKGNDFCQKITYKTTGKKPDDLLAEFRTMYNPRIAVSVDMIATGTDVKPLECLLFMRNVKSAGYFEQMKGRGVRVVDADTLQTVTRDATAKTHFVIVDAVGVCEQDKTDSQPLDREPTVPLAKVLEAVAKGVCNPDVASTLASRLARLDRQLTDAQRSELADLAGGRPMRSLAGDLLGTLDPDAQVRHAAEKFGLADGQEPSPQQVDQAGKDMIRAALKPFYNPALRDRLVEIRRATEQVIDEVTQDVLIQAGFDADAMEKAKAAVEGFRAFIAENKDRIEGIQVLYSRPYREGLRFRHVKELHAALSCPPISTDAQRLWRSYRIVEPSAVRGAGGKPLVDLIALVRHAIDPERPIEPFAATVEERYHAWLGGQAAAGVSFTPEQRRWLDAIKDHIATSVRIDQDDFDDAPFNQLGGLGRVHELFGDRLPAILNELNVRLAA